METLCLLPLTFEVLQQETKRDEQLECVKRYTTEGWPKQVTYQAIQQFYNRRDPLPRDV